jgi:hypothetical protein
MAYGLVKTSAGDTFLTTTALHQSTPKRSTRPFLEISVVPPLNSNCFAHSSHAIGSIDKINLMYLLTKSYVATTGSKFKK